MRGYGTIAHGAKQTFTEKPTSEMRQKPGDHRGSPEKACRRGDSRSSAACGKGPFWIAARASFEAAREQLQKTLGPDHPQTERARKLAASLSAAGA